MESGRENLGESWKQKTVTGIKGQRAELEWRLNDSSRRKILRNKTEECKHETEKARGVLAELPHQTKQHVFWGGKSSTLPPVSD